MDSKKVFNVEIIKSTDKDINNNYGITPLSHEQGAGCCGCGCCCCCCTNLICKPES